MEKAIFCPMNCLFFQFENNLLDVFKKFELQLTQADLVSFCFTRFDNKNELQKKAAFSTFLLFKN